MRLELAARIMSIFSIHDTSAELRFFYLQSSLDMIEDHPFGGGVVRLRLCLSRLQLFISKDVFMYHSHNLFLNITAELGIEGLLLFLFLMVQMFKLARGSGTETDPAPGSGVWPAAWPPGGNLHWRPYGSYPVQQPAGHAVLGWERDCADHGPVEQAQRKDAQNEK